jgi:hypothetical protein
MERLCAWVSDPAAAAGIMVNGWAVYRWMIGPRDAPRDSRPVKRHGRAVDKGFRQFLAVHYGQRPATVEPTRRLRWTLASPGRE